MEDKEWEIALESIQNGFLGPEIEIDTAQIDISSTLDFTAFV